MTVSILLITQNKVGKSLLKAAQNTYKNLPLKVTSFCVSSQADPDNLLPKLQNIVAKIDQGQGVLVLTDLYGSTPSNIAHQLEKTYPKRVEVVAGLNLPMLIKVLNYPNGSLSELADKAVIGGRQGICDH